MEMHPMSGHEHATGGGATQVERMRAAVAKAVAAGPAFLQGKIPATQMANTMVEAVRGYVDAERAAGGDGRAHGREAAGLEEVLRELMACGSGFLAQRCDAACVARTMTQMVQDFRPE